MSSQSGGITFSVSPENDSCVLLELPEHIARGLQNGLKLKSSEDGHAFICIDNETYELRQVQTSNSVHIIQPNDLSGHGEGRTDQLGLVAKTKCGSVLEVGARSDAFADTYLRSLLPPHNGRVDSEWPCNFQKRTTEEIFNAIPLSDGQCREAMSNLIVFSTTSDAYWIPTPRALVQTWSSLLTSLLAEGIDLAGLLHKDDLANGIDGLQDTTKDLGRTIIDKVTKYVDKDHVRLENNVLVAFVGTALLQDLEQVATTEFVRQWTNLLPESLRGQANLDHVPDQFEQVDDHHIRYIGVHTKVEQAATPTATAKRNWHDKFRASRNRK